MCELAKTEDVMIEHKTQCPYCGQKHDVATNIGGNERIAPTDGDFHLCVTCGAFSIYHEGKLCTPTDEEEKELADNDNVKAVRQCWDDFFLRGLR